MPHIATIAPEAAAANEALKAEALRRLLRIGIGGLIGGAGLAGLVHLIKHYSKPKPPSYSVPLDIDMPVPEKKSSAMPPRGSLGRDFLEALYSTVGTLGTKGAITGSDDQQAGSPLQGALRGIRKEMVHVPLTVLGTVAGKSLADRMAAELAARGNLGHSASSAARILGMIIGGTMGYTASKPLVGSLVGTMTKRSDWADSAVRYLLPTPEGQPAPQMFSPRWLRGDTMKEISAIPWVIPGALAVGAGGIAAGSALVNWLMKQRRKKLIREELDRAQKEYEAAMLGQYDDGKEKKGARNYSLDDVADLLEKNGFFNDLLGKSVGGYGALAAILASLAGLGTYRYLKGRSKDELLEKALKQRALVRSLSRPPDIYIHPVRRPLRNEKGTAEELVTEEDRPSL